VVGVSRATKTPTCRHLASAGMTAASMPRAPGMPLATWLSRAPKPLIVDLKADPVRLAPVRAAGLKWLQQAADLHYTDADKLRKEVLNAHRLSVHRGGWVVDVTRRSIEQTAWPIIDMLRARACNPPWPG
jgi:regulator of PEP synthase PpsR (kinase-PPPase family)